MANLCYSITGSLQATEVNGSVRNYTAIMQQTVTVQNQSRIKYTP